MGKRLTDTDKWKKAFLRGLDAPCKLLWFYMCDDCDHAGIWHVDMEVAEIRTGEKQDEEAAIKMLGAKIIIFDGGKKWFIPSFIEFQYPKGLNPANKVHNSVIQILSKYNLIGEDFKPLVSPFHGAKDIYKDKDKEKDTDLGKSENPFPEAVMPARQPITQEMVGEWMKLRPDYPYSQEQDFHAVLQIGKFIADQVKSKWLPEADVGYELIIRAWIRLISWQKQDDFYKGFSLSYLAKTATLQTIWQKSKEVKNGTAHKQTPGSTQFVPTLADPGGFGKL